MKTFKLTLLIVAFAFSAVASATEKKPNPKKSKKQSTTIESTIGNLLERPNFAVNQDEDTIVSLIVNENNELVVLDVASDNAELESFVKMRLNYKKLDFNFEHKNKPLRLPLSLVSK